MQKFLTALVLVLFGAGVTFVVTVSELSKYYTAEIDRVTASQSEIATKTTELESYIDKYFVGDADKTAMADAAASAMVTATGDRWSYYISADSYASYMEQMNNAYVGVGITIAAAEDGSGLTVMEVTAGGPAEEAGVQVGDVMVSVDSTSIADMTTAEVRDLVRGEEGTTVDLGFRRGEETVTLTVERRTIDQVVTTGELLDGNIGYVKIVNFDSNCAAQTIAVIEDLMDQGAESLLFDVRYNPGGYKDELVKVLDYLLPEGVLFRSVRTDGTESIDYSDESCVDLPMAVLVNGDSYSAAEFFAAALQEYGVGQVVGSQTCGKGYFQNTYRLSDGSAVSLSSGTYYTPNNVSLANVGVTPDIPVDLTEDDAALLYYDQLAQSDDAQLQAALEALR